MPRQVWVEFGDDGKVLRICKNQKTAVGFFRIGFVLRTQAVEEIRRQIWERDNKRCTHCGTIVTWHMMNMHERVWRGRGGEVSVSNGTTLCESCHVDDPIAGHGKRKVRFGESS